jgi:uncharacterized protein (DUF1499 family)
MASLLAGRRPSNLGASDGRLAPPKRTPNCVSSQADPADAEHFIAPLAFKGALADAMSAAKKAVASIERSRVVREERGYLYAECASKLLGFVDDLELLFSEKAGVFHVRSASRLGRKDFGVNRRRVEALRSFLAIARSS